MSGRPPAFQLKSILEACNASLAKNPNTNFSDVFSADFATASRRSNCQWIDVMATDCAGVTAPFVMHCSEPQKICGISPLRTEDLAEINERLQKHGYPPKKAREGDPTVNIQLYQDKVPTLPDDEFTVDASKPMPPRSNLVFVVKCYNVWFLTTVKGLKDAKMISDDPAEAAPGALIVSSAKVHPPLATHISYKSPNAGKPLINPTARFKIPMKDGLPDSMQMKNGGLFDASSNLSNPKQWTPLCDKDGVPFNEVNAHRILTSNSDVGGITLRLDSICCSSMGVSTPMKVRTLGLATRSYGGGNDLDELFGDAPEPKAAEAPDPKAAAAEAPAPAAALSADDIEAVLREAAE